MGRSFRDSDRRRGFWPTSTRPTITRGYNSKRALAPPVFPMILPVHARIRSGIRQVLEAAFGLAPAEQPAIVIEMPPNRSMGDLGVPVAFELARRLKRAPRQIASELADRLGPLDGVSRVVPAPNGYLNFFLDRGGFLRGRLGGQTGVRPGSDQGQTGVRPGSDRGQSTGPGEAGSSAEKVI